MESTTKEFLNWIEETSVSVGMIDREHREVAQAINDLHAAMSKGDQQGLTGPLLRKVAELARSHFSSEEGLMAANKYPGMALHLFKHQHLTEQLDALQARVSRGGFKLNEHSLNFLRDWFNIHIQKDDTQFAVWLNDTGKR
jgi:hemerythrin-like metal-binding protein